jgi:hypothetical protein
MCFLENLLIGSRLFLYAHSEGVGLSVGERRRLVM